MIYREGKVKKITKNVRPHSNLLIEKMLIEWTIKTCDALFIHNIPPAIGSVVYCNLGLVAEHSGIYVGRNKIVHLSGDGHIEKVSAKEFCERFSGLNPSFTIFCPVNSNGKAIGDKKVAEYALGAVGRVIEYNPLMRNCHCFSASCVCGKAMLCPGFRFLEKLISDKYGTYNWRATLLNHGD